ncbi:MAG TPA: PilZ domain-containing protein [Thermoanaerobaculia bacterium]|nr:PilZ domain-containing protein [Thermoanaerobaculia bacterium]
MSHYIQKISIDPACEREWWVGWEIDDAKGEIPGLICADAISETELRAKGVREFSRVSLPMLDRVERRRALRVHVEPSIRGMLGTVGVDIVDLSCAGAGILTSMPILAGRKLVIDFDHHEELYSISFAVLRCSASSMSSNGLLYYIALGLVEDDAASRGSLRKLIARIAVRMLRSTDGDWGVYSEGKLGR